MVSSIGLLHGSLGILNLAAASFSLFVIYRKKPFAKTPLGITLTHLVVNQIGYAIFCHIILLLPSKYAQNVVWSSTAACDFYGFIKTYFESSILLNVLSLCLERYMISFHSVKYKAPLYFKLAIGIWLYSALWALFPLVGWGRYNRKGFSCDISILETDGWRDFSYLIAFVFATFVVPSSLMFHLVARYRSRKSTTVWKVNKAEGRVFESTSIERVTTFLAVVSFILTCCKVFLILTDLLPSSVGSGLYLEIFHPITSQSLLFVGPIWHIVAVRRFRQILFGCHSNKKRVKFAEVTYTKGKASESAGGKTCGGSPLIARQGQNTLLEEQTQWEGKYRNDPSV